MKKFILILILTFNIQSWTKADDIKDFEIEGMSIGDSLLDFVTKDYIKNNQGKWYDDEYYQIFINNNNETYEDVLASFRSKDKKYLISSISGSINYGRKITECYKQQDKIDKIFLEIFKNSDRRIDIFEKGSYGPDAGDTNSKQIVYELSSGTAVIDCLDWDQKSKPDYNDRILISVDNDKFREWLIKHSQ